MLNVRSFTAAVKQRPSCAKDALSKVFLNSAQFLKFLHAHSTVRRKVGHDCIQGSKPSQPPRVGRRTYFNEEIDWKRLQQSAWP